MLRQEDKDTSPGCNRSPKSLLVQACPAQEIWRGEGILTLKHVIRGAGQEGGGNKMAPSLVVQERYRIEHSDLGSPGMEK